MEIAVGGRLLYLNPSLKSLSYAPKLMETTCHESKPSLFSFQPETTLSGRSGFVLKVSVATDLRTKRCPLHCNIYLTLALGTAAGKQLSKQ